MNFKAFDRCKSIAPLLRAFKIGGKDGELLEKLYQKGQFSFTQFLGMEIEKNGGDKTPFDVTLLCIADRIRYIDSYTVIFDVSPVSTFVRLVKVEIDTLGHRAILTRYRPLKQLPEGFLERVSKHPSLALEDTPADEVSVYCTDTGRPYKSTNRIGYGSSFQFTIYEYNKNGEVVCREKSRHEYHDEKEIPGYWIEGYKISGSEMDQSRIQNVRFFIANNYHEFENLYVLNSEIAGLITDVDDIESFKAWRSTSVQGMDELEIEIELKLQPGKRFISRYDLNAKQWIQSCVFDIENDLPIVSRDVSYIYNYSTVMWDGVELPGDYKRLHLKDIAQSNILKAPEVKMRSDDYTIEYQTLEDFTFAVTVVAHPNEDRDARLTQFRFPYSEE
jgi:hypothetical protein